MQNRLTALTFLCLTLNHLGFGQDDKVLETFVITAQYEETSKEKAVNKIRVINREKIDALAAVNLGDVLKNELNIRLSQDNVLGTFMSLQGISGQNVKILFDGIPIIGRLNGSIDVSQINLNDIERIEIVEGPLSVNYGTDALAGTINLITKKKNNDGISYNINTYFESAGQYNLDGDFNFKKNNNLFKFSAGRNLFDGWSAHDPFFQFPKSRPADSLRSKSWNPKEQFFGSLNHIHSKDKLTIRSYFNYFDEQILNRGMPRNPYFETAFDDYYNTWRKDVGVDIKNKLSNGGRLKLLAGYNHYKRIKLKYLKDLTNLEQQLTQTPGDQDTTIFDMFISRGSYSKVNGKLNYQIGYEVDIESSIGKRIEGESREQSNFAIFGSAKWKASKKLIIQPALRLAYNSSYQAPPIPSLNIKYAKNNLQLRGSYAKGFRAPSLKELYFYFVDINHNIVGNSNLSEESSNNFTGDISWKKSYDKCILNIDGGVFYNDINNLITLAVTDSMSQQFSYVNIGNYKTTGIKINSELKYSNLNINLSAAHIGRYNNLHGEHTNNVSINGTTIFESNVDLPKFIFSPEIRSNIVYNWSKYNLRFSTFYKYNGPIIRFNLNNEDEIVESKMSGFNTLDANITKLFKLKKQSKLFIEWSFGLKNIFDVQSVATTGISGGVHSGSTNSLPVGWGRSIFSSLKFRFN